MAQVAQDSGLAICEAAEGYALELPDGSVTSYWDRLGCVWTCGYGSTGADITRATHWSREQAEERLMIGWNAAKNGVLKLSPILAKYPHRLDACTDFAYNLGVGRYQASTLRKLVNAQQWSAAAGEFGKWVLAGGKVQQGLVRRRSAEKTLFDSEATNSPRFEQPAVLPTVSAYPSVQDEPTPSVPRDPSAIATGLDSSSFVSLLTSFAKRLGELLQTPDS